MEKNEKKTEKKIEQAEKTTMRLAKFLASAGIASRRNCEDLIIQGNVCVNGEPVLTPAFSVDPAKDEVTFQGKKVTPHQDAGLVYIMLNKPAGYTCSAKDEHAKYLVYDLIPKKYGRLFTVGRLDRASEGLLILTNDGDFAQRMTHPSYQVVKKYLVDCEGNFTTALRRELMEGVYDGGEFLKPLNVEAKKVLRGHCLLEVTLTEGKKREVRRMCKAVGLPVNALTRVAFGSLELGNLAVKCWRMLGNAEVASLMKK